MLRSKTDESVKKMVGEAMKDWKEREDATAVESLPEALYETLHATHSKAAGNALMTLELDGGPAETLSGVHVSMLENQPTFCANWLRATYKSPEAAVWHTKFRHYESFTVDIYEETSDDKALYKRLLSKFKAMHNETGRFLTRYLVKLPHLTP